MSDNSQFTLAQLSFNKAEVYAVCDRCGHFGVVSFDFLCKLGLKTLVSEAARRFRCRICGTKRTNLVDIRPLVGEQVCPQCHGAPWKPKPPGARRICKRCMEPY